MTAATPTGRGQRIAAIKRRSAEILEAKREQIPGMPPAHYAAEAGHLTAVVESLCQQLDALLIPAVRPFKRGEDTEQYDMPFGGAEVPVVFVISDGRYFTADVAWINGAWVQVEDHFSEGVIADWNERAEKLSDRAAQDDADSDAIEWEIERRECSGVSV